MARAIHVALAGPRSYDGRMQSFPWVNPDGAKSSDAHSIKRAVRTLWLAWGLGLILTVAIAVLF